MNNTFGPLFVALAVAAFVPSLSGAEGCLGSLPLQAQVLALDAKTGQAKEVYQVTGGEFTQPAIAAGVLYVGSGYTLRAVQLQGGKLLWTFKADYTVYDIKPTPQAVFCGAGSTLYSVNPATGKENWKYESNGAVSGLILTDGLVVFGSHNGVCAVDQQTGKERWLLPGSLGWCELSLGGKGTVCSWDRENTFVADLKKGKWLWKEKSVGDRSQRLGFPVNVVASEGRLFSIPTLDKAKGKITVVAKDVVTRQQLWQETLDAKVGKDLALHVIGEQLLVVNSEGDNAVFALAAATGQVQWQRPKGHFIQPAANPLSIFATDGHHVVWAIDRQTGKDRWEYAPPKLPEGQDYSIRPPTVAPDGIYVTVNRLGGFRGGK
jgi:outer membrane protein assembly factor BamB